MDDVGQFLDQQKAWNPVLQILNSMKYQHQFEDTFHNSINEEHGLDQQRAWNSRKDIFRFSQSIDFSRKVFS
jgi:hypothetical protein